MIKNAIFQVTIYFTRTTQLSDQSIELWVSATDDVIARKKAVAKICDSVVVVAFYTDQILVKGGPESFNGLPGMILGLAIPRLSETIYATKLELTNPEIPTPSQGKSKVVKRVQISADLKKGLEQWGKFGKVISWSNSF